jgi:ubiquitin-protein ligase
MYQSPHLRRLRNDLTALERLRSESTVFRFASQGDPPQVYQVAFRGKGLYRDRNRVRVTDTHRVEIKLGSSYPRTMPEIRWVTPIYHPNISEIGMVCLGGYGTHWVPSIQLDELCSMLWDMARYHNYDIRSPYNRDAALWVASQTTFLFPMDPRPLRDVRAAMGRVQPNSESANANAAGAANSNGEAKRAVQSHWIPVQRVREFIRRQARSAGDVVSRQSSNHTGPPPLARPVPEPRPQSNGCSTPDAAGHQGDAEADVLVLDEAPPRPVQPGPEPPAAENADEIIFLE